MIKMPLLKWTFFFLILTLGSYWFTNHVMADDFSSDEKIVKILPQQNKPEKILSLKSQYKINVKYKSIEDEKSFKNTLIGVWGAPPQGTVEFRADGKFESKNYEDNKVLSGLWEYHDGALKISFDGKKWDIYKILEYGLNFFEDRGKKHYSFKIKLDKMICNLSDIIFINFNTKSLSQ